MTLSTQPDLLPRLEATLTQLMMLIQHQSMDIAQLADEVTALRRAVPGELARLNHELNTARDAQQQDLARLEGQMSYLSKRADWFNVQSGELLRVLLAELREVRATQVCAAINDGPISAELLADLVRPTEPDALLLELPKRA